MIETLALGPSDRVFILLPHPDDESAATGGLLQHALATGAKALVVFFTNGDNNPWAQRANEFRWRIGPVDRARFASRRGVEVRAALERLGVPETSCRFLGYPDQSATDLLLRGNSLALGNLVDELREWRPDVVVGPSLLDLHPDHSALGVMLDLALAALRDEVRVRRHVRFVVHNPRLRARLEGSAVLALTSAQQASKREAILCHKTQLALRGSWLPGFAEPEERYYVDEPAAGIASHPVRAARREADSVAIELASRTHLRAFGGRVVCIVGSSGPDRRVRLAVRLPSGGGTAPVEDLQTGQQVAEAQFAGRRGTGTLRLPRGLLESLASFYAKVERRHGFFDEAGWKRIDPDAAPC